MKVLNVVLILFGLPLLVTPLAVMGLRELARVQSRARARAEQRRQVIVMTVVKPAPRAPAAIQSGKHPAKELTR